MAARRLRAGPAVHGGLVPRADAQIGDAKERLALGELCAGLPDEFAAFLAYARELKFEDKPDYAGLRLAFWRLLQAQCPGATDSKIEW